MTAENDVTQYSSLESWLYAQPDDQFPYYNAGKGELSYPEKFKQLKTSLQPLHSIVEKGAMVESIYKWRKELEDSLTVLTAKDEVSKQDVDKINQQLDSDPIIYLNQHGLGHVDKVAEKAFELVKRFTRDSLSPTEVFILLCAIQVHDVGNIFGRDGHEISLQQATIDTMRPIIPDAPTQKMIYRIAQVHSGKINGSKDTISTSALSFERSLFDKKPIREPLIAAILRFADELADDSSRADKKALELNTIPEESIIYHQYSTALHAVNINKNDINQSLYLSLDYYLDAQSITNTFIKNGKPRLLIDEIFSRTIKVEQERRYCMRFFSQYLPLVEVRVQIQIDSDFDLLEPLVINYTLKEYGYPAQEIVIDCPENTGEKVISLLKGKGWLV